MEAAASDGPMEGLTLRLGNALPPFPRAFPTALPQDLGNRSGDFVASTIPTAAWKTRTWSGTREVPSRAVAHGGAIEPSAVRVSHSSHRPGGDDLPMFEDKGRKAGGPEPFLQNLTHTTRHSRRR